MIVWLVSYPRSGNTFFRVVLNSVFNIKTYSIYNDSSDIGADEATSDVVGHEFLPKDFNLDLARKEKKIYYIKTHELIENIDLNANDKIIYLVRDGRESSLSFSKYLQDFQNKDDSILLDVLYGNTSFGSWGEHVRQWSPVDKFVVKFENLIDDPVGTAKKIAKYLDIQIINEEIPTFEQLHKVNSKFFRSGKKDSWKKSFSKTEQIIFWGSSFGEMLELNYIDKVPKELLKSVYKDEILKNYSLIVDESKKKHEKNKALHDKLGIFTKQLQTTQQQLQEKIKMIYQKDEQIKQKEGQIKRKDEQILDLKNSKTFKIGDLFFRSVKKPYKLITFPINLIKILSK